MKQFFFIAITAVILSMLPFWLCLIKFRLIFCDEMFGLNSLELKLKMKNRRIEKNIESYLDREARGSHERKSFLKKRALGSGLEIYINF